jgi:hypothetical protein
MVFVSHSEFPKILEPGKKPFNFPSSSISSKCSAILGFRLLSTLSMGGNHFYAAFIHQGFIKAVTIICFIANQPIRSIFCKAAVNRLFNQFYFVGRSTFHVSGDRKTRSVRDCHDLGAFATLRLADSKTPFFAGTNVPSMKASLMLIWPRAYRSCASSWTILRNSPCFTHCWNRLWHVWYGGYLVGKSCQGAPVRNIHKIPFKTSRGSLGFRPRGSFRGVVALISCSILFHCLFVSFILIILHNQDVMPSFILNNFR